MRLISTTKSYNKTYFLFMFIKFINYLDHIIKSQ